MIRALRLLLPPLLVAGRPWYADMPSSLEPPSNYSAVRPTSLLAHNESIHEPKLSENPTTTEKSALRPEENMGESKEEQYTKKLTTAGKVAVALLPPADKPWETQNDNRGEWSAFKHVVAPCVSIILSNTMYSMPCARCSSLGVSNSWA